MLHIKVKQTREILDYTGAPVFGCQVQSVDGIGDLPFSFWKRICLFLAKMSTWVSARENHQMISLEASSTMISPGKNYIRPVFIQFLWFCSAQMGLARYMPLFSCNKCS